MLILYLLDERRAGIYRNQNFAQIAKDLERHFNVEIRCDDSNLNQEKYNASFDNKSIEEILSYFKDSYQINYTIDDGKVHMQ